MTPAVSVSLVVYHPDLAVLRPTVASLRVALDHAKNEGVIRAASVALVDNGAADEAALDAMIEEELEAAPWVSRELHRGHGNVRNGLTITLPILSPHAHYHLVLNPDVVLEPDAIAEAIRFLSANPDVGLLAPDIHSPSGERQYVCRRYPSVLMLFLR